MSLRRACLFLTLLLAFGCSEPEGPTLPPEPENLIEQEKMVQVLADVHLMEAALGMRSPLISQARPKRPGMNPQTGQQTPIIPENIGLKSMPYFDIFKKHGVTFKQYESSMTWYAAQPEI
ncbi:MAG: DUF4296 domain-containing protein, partial [Bacteroidia bacterium]